MKRAGIKPSFETYKTLIAKLHEHDNGALLRRVFVDMLQAGVAPDLETFHVILARYATERDVDSVAAIFSYMQEVGLGEKLPFRTLVSALPSEEGLRTYERMRAQNVELGVRGCAALFDLCARAEGAKALEGCAAIARDMAARNTTLTRRMYEKLMKLKGEEANVEEGMKFSEEPENNEEEGEKVKEAGTADASAEEAKN